MHCIALSVDMVNSASNLVSYENYRSQQFSSSEKRYSISFLGIDVQMLLDSYS